MKKKVTASICSIALTGSLIGATVLPVQAAASNSVENQTVVQQVDSHFQDITVDHDAYEAIVWAKNRGIVSGYADGTFKPNDAITEAQFAKMLSQFLSLKDDKGDLIKSTSASHWADGYYDSLATYGAPLNAYFDNTLRNKPVKRGVVAQAISYLTGGANSLSDSIDFMIATGITTGQNPQFEGKDLYQFFGSTNNLTRAQVASFLYRMHNGGLEGATGIAVEVHNNPEALSLVGLANKGMSTLDSSLRLGTLGSETPPKNETTEPVVKVDRAYIPVENLMQKPDLPNGCEIVSLTAVLNYYGYNVSKTTMADNYLPKQAFSWKNGKRYGSDPYKAYAGNPRSTTSGWYSFAPPIVKATDNYMATQQNKMKGKDISGSSQKEILTYLNNGVPVVIWITLDLSKPALNGQWYLSDTGKYYKAYTNLHAVVLKGYKDGIVSVMNPLKGQVTYNQNAFFKSYEELGKHAMVLTK